MKKMIFTAVLLTAGVAFASAQTTESKDNDATEKKDVVVDSATTDSTLKSEVVIEDNQVKTSDPNANQQQQADQEKKSDEQQANDQARKEEEE